MKRDAERLTKLLDIEATVYDQTSLPDYIDTSRYCGGMMRDDIGGIHPAKLLAGMCQIARASFGQNCNPDKNDCGKPAKHIITHPRISY